MAETITELQQQIVELKDRIREMRREAAPQPIDKNYTFVAPEGAVSLADLFGEQENLLVIHNMGGGCNYCTMWADGFSGYLRHLERRAAFVLVSPDSTEQQRKIAEARGWTFRMVQDAEKTFTADMGFWAEQDGYWPGVSAFHRQPDGTIVRTGVDFFGPRDEYCLAWPMFDLLHEGPKDFSPK